MGRPEMDRTRRIGKRPRGPPTPAGGMGGDELDAITDGLNEGIDGGEAAEATRAPVETPAADQHGPGISAAEVETLAAPLAEAEAWLAGGNEAQGLTTEFSVVVEARP